MARISRIRGQVEAIERALNEEKDCAAVLQTIAACRGAINGLMAEVMEGHIREHILDPAQDPTSTQQEAAEDIIDLIKSYLK
jgi:DNA-binding FrmR family transcriptional regulator